jgi:predicted small lipoprotein YifL
MKKLLILLLVLAMVFAFGACGSNDAPEPAVQEEVEATPEVPQEEPEEVEEPEELEEEPMEEPEPEEAEPVADGAIVGPAEVALGTARFQLHPGWVFEGDEEDTSSVIRVDDGENDVVIIIVNPIDRLSNAERLAEGNLPMTFEGILLNTWLNNLFEDRQSENIAAVTDLQYPALMATYIAQNRSGTWAPGTSILFFGEEQFIMFHAFMRETSDTFIDEFMEFVRSVEFAG